METGGRRSSKVDRIYGHTGMAKGEKTGGRTAGTPNKLTAKMREAIVEEVGLIEFFTAYINGHEFAYTGTKGEQVVEVAPLKDRKDAAFKLMDMVVPKPKEADVPAGGGADGTHEQWLDALLRQANSEGTGGADGGKAKVH